MLRGIWNEIKALNERANANLEAVRSEVGELRATTDRRFEDLEKRFGALHRAMVEGDVRIATEVTALAGAVRDLSDHLRGQRVDTERLAKVEARLDAVEKAVRGAAS